MHGGSSENKIENGKESVLAHLPSLSLGFKDLSMLHWSKINLNDPLKASAREKHQYLALHLKSLSTALLLVVPGQANPHLLPVAGLDTCYRVTVTWTELVCTHSTVTLQVALTCSWGTHRNHLEPHPQQDQGRSKAGAQWKMSHTVPCVVPKPWDSRASHTWLPSYWRSSQQQVVNSKKISDWTEKASFSFWGT